MTLARQFSREENEHAIRVLVTKYPKCFFEDPKLRRPLKKNIVADLQADGCPLAEGEISAAIAWYESHFAYHYALQAGAKRIDLDGKENGTVTELEQRNARNYIAERKRAMSERNLNLAIPTTTSLVLARRVPDDALRKIDLTPESLPMTATKADPLAKLQGQVDALRRVIEVSEPMMQTALMAAGLKVIISEAENMITDLGHRPTSAIMPNSEGLKTSRKKR
jgi:hypothetical protein